jgi:enoyl-CoA hydratase/carnithine racemase
MVSSYLFFFYLKSSLQSPTSLKVTFEQIKRGKQLDLKDCLIMEYQMVQNVMKGHDFFEGVRAGKDLFNYQTRRLYFCGFLCSFDRQR